MSIVICNFDAFKGGISEGIFKFIETIPDFLCLQMSGVFYPATNSVLWYISAMMIAGFFIASLFRISPKITSNFLIPIFALGGYSIIYLGAGNLDVSTLMHGKHIMTPGVIRAFAGMSMGGGIYLIYRAIRSLGVVNIQTHTLSISLLQIFIMIIVVLLFIRYPHTQYDFLHLIFFPILILFSMLQLSPWSQLLDKVGNSGIKFLGKEYTLAMYCFSTITSAVIAKVFPLNNIDIQYGTIIYLILWLLVSWVITKINQFVKNH